jgi:DAK2 domain fusion protein YloV
MESKSEQTQTPAAGATACDGQELKRLAVAGLAWLEQNYEAVNALNVFPVPDGDTGTNMLLTMRSAYKEIADSDEPHLGKMAQIIYNGALMGARGNSGVILSQLWRGFSTGVEEEAKLSAQALARGLVEASKTADKAVQEPVEGTMLTVARDAAQEAVQAAGDGDDLPTMLERIVERSHESVERTPDLLDVLREAGVVDAGGRGLALILEGMLRYLRGQPVAVEEHDLVEAHLVEGSIDLSGLDYPYDVQFLLHGPDLDVDTITRTIDSMGDSTLVVGDANLLKVHVHVVNPGEPLAYAANLGQLEDVVVENMRLQYEQFAERGGPHASAIPTVEPPEIEPGTIAAVTVTPGEGLTNIFYSLGVGTVIAGGQTMNPSTEQFVEAIASLPTDKVIILPNNKNIIMSAEEATKLVNSKKARVVPTRTIPQGIAAILALNPEGDIDQVVEAMLEASQMVETGEVTTATRNATLDGVKVKKGQIIGLHNETLRIAGDDVNSVVLELLDAMEVDDFELVTLYYGADIDPGSAHALCEHLAEQHPDHEIELREGGQAHYFYILSAE